ncbi:serine/threonine-protein phosphatase 2A activator-like protein [Neoconidiobolus thromboides FSU 785]|nr:serine/threonine-protein phosphatase 2A activator-like protein [Neoconidiobolus thromboides FSU 785]
MASISYKVPERRILKEEDMSLWKNSQGYQDILQFIKYMNDQVKGKIINNQDKQNESITKCVKMLSMMEAWIKDIKLIEDGSRFGNLAFREWHKKLENEINVLLDDLLNEEIIEAKIELRSYLLNSFGNSTRIDYGTGHEFHFIIFLYGLIKIEYFKKEDCINVILIIFKRYLNLVRQLQLTYKLEPAGSHGVWGLDDFQFLPYIFGSAQLIPEQDVITPLDILNKQIIDEKKESNLFFECIDFIHQAKKGPFYEHSPTLYQISQVPYWLKVNNGLIKMFEEEVLNKFPIMQHCLFGTIFSFDKN